jgi:hypothetical protein
MGFFSSLGKKIGSGASYLGGKISSGANYLGAKAGQLANSNLVNSLPSFVGDGIRAGQQGLAGVAGLGDALNVGGKALRGQATLDDATQKLKDAGSKISAGITSGIEAGKRAAAAIVPAFS